MQATFCTSPVGGSFRGGAVVMQARTPGNPWSSQIPAPAAAPPEVSPTSFDPGSLDAGFRVWRAVRCHSRRQPDPVVLKYCRQAYLNCRPKSREGVEFDAREFASPISRRKTCAAGACVWKKVSETIMIHRYDTSASGLRKLSRR
jgi:hypothetical protein